MTKEQKTGAQQVRRTVWQDGVIEESDDWVADEVAVALMYNCISHVVMMTTPRDLQDFAIGFSLSEGIVQKASDILDIEINDDEHGIVIAMLIPETDCDLLKEQRRNMTGRTGCGLCGAETLEQAIKPPRKVGGELTVSADAIQQASSSFTARDQQALMALTGALHGAAWCDPQGRIQLMREDVGRHNALDKLIGAIARAGLDDQGFVMVSSRASYEMVSKVAMANIKLMVAVSAPTGLAIDMAQESGVSLVARSRDQCFAVYTKFNHIQL